jgi:energy-coupling factor transporter ATP-binding protein EcfA2
MTGELVPLTGVVRPHAHLRIAKFSQHFVDVLDMTLSPLDYFLSIWLDLTREEGRKFLGRFGISGSVQTQVMSQLSDGQKSRVVLAKMAKESPHMLFLDEPTNHLDMESIDSLAKAINNFSGGMMLVSHDMRLISQVAKEIWLCDNHTVAKYVGEISDFKMQLRRQMKLDNGDGPAREVTTVPLVSKKLSDMSHVEVPKFAPAAPIMAPVVSAAAPSIGKAGEDGDGEEEGADEKEDKAAARARRRAEREAALAARQREEEERQLRKEEKLREAEEAKRVLEEEQRKIKDFEMARAEREASCLILCPAQKLSLTYSLIFYSE